MCRAMSIFFAGSAAEFRPAALLTGLCKTGLLKNMWVRGKRIQPRMGADYTDKWEENGEDFVSKRVFISRIQKYESLELLAFLWILSLSVPIRAHPWLK